MTNRALVTGGAGFIGSHLVERLLGWRPGIAFEDGIAEVVDWVEANWDRVKEQPLEYMHRP